MSKSKDSDSDVDIYGDLPNFSADNTIAELENAKRNLQNELRDLKAKLEEMQIKHDKLEKENEALSINISSLYKTAACEIKRKDQMIQELRKEKDAILFRRRRKETQNHYRSSSQADEVLFIEDNQHAAEKVFEEKSQYDNTAYQHAGDMQYDEPEIIASFPEEDVEDDCVVQEMQKKFPDTIFSRRKAQQFKLINKKSHSFKDSVEVRPEQSEILVEDSDENQSTVSDKRKSQQLPAYNAQHAISEDVVQVSYGSTDTSSSISAETKSLAVNNRRIDVSTKKRLRSFKQVIEANIKSSSKENESSTSPLKARQSLRTEDVRDRRTKSCYKIKEHSKADQIRSEKDSHAVSEDGVQVNVTPSCGSTEKSSILCAESLNLNSRTDLSTNNQASSFRKTTEANIKSSKENESTVPMIARQSLRTEVVKDSRSKSYHKNKEHSEVDKTRSERHSHSSSKDRDRRSASDVSSHRKSSSGSKSKYSGHVSSHKSSLENCYSSKASKSRSIRETSVSRALKSLRSRTHLKESEDKNSRRKEVESHGNKRGETSENKKQEVTIERLLVTKLPTEISKDLRENVPMKPKVLASDTTRMIINDLKTSDVRKDSCTKTNNHNKKQDKLQGQEKPSEKEEDSIKESEKKNSRRKEVGHGSKRGENKKKELATERLSVTKLPIEISTDLREDVPMKPKILASDTTKMIVVDLRTSSDVSKDSCTKTNNHNKKQEKPSETEEDSIKESDHKNSRRTEVGHGSKRGETPVIKKKELTTERLSVTKLPTEISTDLREDVPMKPKILASDTTKMIIVDLRTSSDVSKDCYTKTNNHNKKQDKLQQGQEKPSEKEEDNTKESEHKNSSRKEVEGHGSKRGETPEIKKKELTTERLSVTKLPTEISTDRMEDVPMKPKIIASDTTKMIIVDLRTSSDVSKDSCTKTNNHNKKQGKLQQGQEKPSEKEEDSTKESEHKNSRRKVEGHGSKRGETLEIKKKELTERLSVTKLPTEISTDRMEDVPMKPKILASDTTKMIIVDLRTSLDVSKDSCTKTNNHNKKQDKLQQGQEKRSEKDDDNIRPDLAADSGQENDENISKITLFEKVICKLQKFSDSNSDMTADRHDDNSALDKEGTNEMSAETQVLQKNISEEPQGHDLSQNKSINQTPMDIDLSPKKGSSEFPATDIEVIANVVIADEEPIMEVVNEKSVEDKLCHDKIGVDPSQGDNELTSDDCINEVSSVEHGISLHVESRAVSTGIPRKSQKCVETSIDAKDTNDSTEDVQASNKSYPVEATKTVTDYSAAEENNAPSLCNKEQRPLKPSHLAVLGSKQDYSTRASETFLETEPADTPRDVTINTQTLSNEENITPEILNKDSVSKERTGQCLVKDTDANLSLVEPVNESLFVERQLNKPANQTQHNLNESVSPTAIFTHGNGSFAVVNEHGCFRRRKLKRISNENITVASNVTETTSNDNVKKEKVIGTKRAHEHTNTGSSESPPAKKRALEDPQMSILHLPVTKDNFTGESRQSSSIQAEVTGTNISNDKNNTSELEEGEIEDDDNERAVEDSKKVNSKLPRTKVSKSVIHRESNARKEQSRKYLDLGRKSRENRRKSHGSHLQEMSKGSRDKRYLPAKLFSHCKRRSPSELLIKDRNIKGGTSEKEKDSSRSTSSEASRNTNERLKEVPKKRYRSKENASKEEKQKVATSSSNKTVLQNSHVNKQKDVSARVQITNHTSNDDKGNIGSDNVQSSGKEHSTVHSRSPSSANSFKIPITSSQTGTPVTRYVVKRRSVCNLRDSGSFPVVNISPPTPVITTNNSNTAESVKSVQLNFTATPKPSMPTSQVLKKTNLSPRSKEKSFSKTSSIGAPQPNLNSSKTSSPNNKSLARSYNHSSMSQVCSESSTSSSSSSSEYENNSDETWNPKGRRRKRTRKNPKTEVTKSKADELSF